MIRPWVFRFPHCARRAARAPPPGHARPRHAPAATLSIRSLSLPHMHRCTCRCGVPQSPHPVSHSRTPNAVERRGPDPSAETLGTVRLSPEPLRRRFDLPTHLLGARHPLFLTSRLRTRSGVEKPPQARGAACALSCAQSFHFGRALGKRSRVEKATPLEVQCLPRMALWIDCTESGG